MRTRPWLGRALSPQRGLSVLLVALLLALVGHFGAVMVYLMPLNPLKARLTPAVNRYVEPFFTQRWELFAPDPLVDTRYLLASCRLAADGRETPWSNMTAPLRALKYRYRLTPADRLDRVLEGALHAVFLQQDALSAKLDRHRQEEPEPVRRALEAGDRERARRVQEGLRLMNRIASAYCDQLYGPGGTRDVRVRMVAVAPPPFSERHKPDEAGVPTYVDFDWARHEPVAAF